MHAVEVGHVAAMDTELREQLSNLQGLLMLSMLMIESGDETKILQLAASAVPSFGCFHMVGVHLSASGWRTTETPAPPPAVRVQVAAQLSTVAKSGGVILVPGQAWGWALPLRSVGGHIGYFVAAASKGTMPARAVPPSLLGATDRRRLGERRSACERARHRRRAASRQCGAGRDRAGTGADHRNP